MESHAATERDMRDERVDRYPSWLLGLVPLLLIIAAIGAFAALDGPGLGDRRGPPAEELAVEKTVLEPGTIELTVRNDGPDAVAIAQAQVNDAFVQFTGAEEPIGRLDTATVRIQQPWVEGEAYEVALLTSSGGTIAHEIPVAVETPAADLSFFGLMALLGIYVGVIPVALGMLWLPWVRRIPPGSAARRHGAHDRPARVPRDRRDARGVRAGGRGLAGASSAPGSCSSARPSPSCC